MRRWGIGVVQVGRYAVLIREPISATILRQSIIIFPICIATKLLFKSTLPLFPTPLQPLTNPRRASATQHQDLFAWFNFFSPWEISHVMFCNVSIFSIETHSCIGGGLMLFVNVKFFRSTRKKINSSRSNNLVKILNDNRQVKWMQFALGWNNEKCNTKQGIRY